MSNHLKDETSPYLLQHKDNPVDWYPWGEEAFEKAKKEDKPVFLSVGYSTCHWCHVMAHESFEDEETAQFLNEHFVSIKVDKEERPDIDSIYMSFCQAFTGSGGWPMSIFMTPDQQPFLAGTYYPNQPRFGMRPFIEILQAIEQGWRNNREQLLKSAGEMISLLQQGMLENQKREYSGLECNQLFDKADKIFLMNFDSEHGGFGIAPKFPTPHKLLYLLTRFEKYDDRRLLEMVEKTLIQMYRGGLYDHIGYGFSRYSTDERFLVPHFEKMLYDNALLIMAYSKAYEVTKKPLFLMVAKQTADYILSEMTDPEGGFYSAQDADVEGEEGLYYLLTPKEIIGELGEEQGNKFNQRFHITYEGNFEEKNIPNLLENEEYDKEYNYRRDLLYNYRKKRYHLHLDDKILTSWNGLMIGAFCWLYRISKEEKYLNAAKKAQQFIFKNLSDHDTLYVSFRAGKCQNKGFLDDYANEIFALLCLYDATLQADYARQAEALCQKVMNDFWDEDRGGCYLYGEEHESLILRPKETYDGAMPSGNSMMAYNLVRICLLAENPEIELSDRKEKQLAYMVSEASSDPSSYTMFLLALLQEEDPPEKIVVVPEPGTTDILKLELPLKVSLDSVVRVIPGEADGFKLNDNKTTYYICKGHQCMAGSNELSS